MQRIATQAFGVIGAPFFFVVFAADWPESIGEVVFAPRGVSGCVVLSSFGVSVATKYLGDDS